MDKVTAALKPLEILSSSKNSVRFRLKDNKKYVIVPVSIKHNTAVIGECAAVAKMEKIQIKGMEWVNSTLHIRMEWPKEAVLAIALYGTDSYAKNLEDRAGKTSRSVSKKQFEADGALLLKNIEKKDYFITLFSACRVNGELVYSDGARLTFTNKEKTDIHYTIRRKGFLNKQVEIEFKSTVKTFALPEIDLISKQHAVPVYANSGNLARHIAAQEVCGSHIELFEAKSFPKDSYIKAFFTDEDINDKLKDAINIFRGLKQDLTISKFDDYEKNWIKRCAVELIERGEKLNLSSYSENGYSESYFTDLISDSLKREVFQKLKVF